MEDKIRKSTILAGRTAEERGLTAYEGQTIYKRYIGKQGKTLDDPIQMRIFTDMINLYKNNGCRFLLHEPELFEMENDRG